MLKKSTIFYICIGLFSTIIICGQNREDEQGKIEESEIVIRKDRKITLPAATRNFEKIPQVPVRKATNTQNYDFKTYNFKPSPISPGFRAIGFQSNEKPQEITGNYVKAGYGNYSTPYLEAYLGSLRNKNYVFSLYGKHLSSKKGPVFDENSGSSETAVSMGGKYFSGTNTLSGTLNYNANKVHFYGYNPVLDLSSGDIEQKFTNFSMALGVEKTNKEEAGSYHFNTEWSHIKDSYEAKESKFDFDMGLGYQANDQLSFKLDALITFSKREDTEAVNRNYFNIRPRIVYTGGQVKISAGANLADDNDDLPTDADENFNFFPFVKINVNVTPNVAVYAGYEGDLQLNTLHSFVKENPWLQPDFVLYNTKKESDFYGGATFRLTEEVRWNIGLSSASLKMLPFFTNGITDSTRFEVLYDGGDTDRFHIYSEVSYLKNKKWNGALKFNYYRYSLSTLDEPFHLPQYTLTLNTGYSPIEKLNLKGDLYFLGGIKGLNQESNIEAKLDNIIDLNLAANYQLSKQFSVFIQLNNVFGKEYERYLNYPVRGIQFLGGLALSF